MKVTQMIAMFCTTLLAAAVIVGCSSKGHNSSEDYHDNDMQRTDAPKHGHYKDK